MNNINIVLCCFMCQCWNILVQVFYFWHIHRHPCCENQCKIISNSIYSYIVCTYNKFFFAILSACYKKRMKNLKMLHKNLNIKNTRVINLYEDKYVSLHLSSFFKSEREVYDGILTFVWMGTLHIYLSLRKLVKWFSFSMFIRVKPYIKYLMENNKQMTPP